jgi:hypothetical protein
MNDISLLTPYWQQDRMRSILLFYYYLSNARERWRLMLFGK